MRLRHAITRAPSARMPEALVRERPAAPVDVARGRRQHAAYEAALADAGLTVTSLPPLDAHPDCCFVEDTAVVARGVALVTASAAPSRRGEEEAVAAALAPRVRVVRMEPPATLDGGDCLRVGERLFVGLSARSNAGGVDALRRTFEPLGLAIVPLPVGDALHLKSVCSALPDGRILVAAGRLPADCFGELEVVEIPEDEAAAANCLSLADRVLVADGFPETRARIEALGHRVVALDVSEMHKADGALTCLSILL